MLFQDKTQQSINGGADHFQLAAGGQPLTDNKNCLNLWVCASNGPASSSEECQSICMVLGCEHRSH